jgi:hypothetical protein
LGQIQNNGQPTVPLCSLHQTSLVKKAHKRKETTPEQIMLASKVGLVVSGANHKLSITELNHSCGKNNEQAAQAAGGGGPIGRNGRENEEVNNRLVGLEAVFNCCLDLMSHNIQRITPWRATRPHQLNNGACNQGANQQAGNQPNVSLSLGTPPHASCFVAKT